MQELQVHQGKLYEWVILICVCWCNSFKVENELARTNVNNGVWMQDNNPENSVPI